MKKVTPALTPEQLLARYPPPIRKLADRLRTLIRSAVPGVDERAHAGWRLIGYRHVAYFCCVVPQPDHVRLGFEHGIELTDPHGILEGNGTQMRWITFKDEATLDEDKVRDVVALAARHEEQRQRKPWGGPRRRAKRSTT